MTTLRLILPAALGTWLGCASALPAAEAIQADVRARVDREYGRLFELYQHWHTHPELSFQEEQTSARLADEWRQAGYEVTTNVGKFGVVAILRNGPGPTVLVRTDMDGLPVQEQTGLPYASTAKAKDSAGKEVSVMHACGHDVHMACAVGTARLLNQLKDKWAGTLILIGQPAEERGGGARAMLADGLFNRFPRPDFCLALHDDAEFPAGMVNYTPGFALANVDSVDITIHGIGGHGAYPHKTKDPIVLAAQVVLALQTIVSRELEPGEPGVVTVGSIQGGSKHNIISDEVRLQLTVRSYTDAARQQLLEAIRRIVRGQAIAFGIPETKLPEVKLQDEFTPATYNNPELTERIRQVFVAWLGETNVARKKPVMGGEDFGEFGRTAEKVPIFIFNIGGVAPDAWERSRQTGKSLPSLHSPMWAPLPEPTIKTGVIAMTAAVLDLMGKR
jgi:hippurate hydrolase